MSEPDRERPLSRIQSTTRSFVFVEEKGGGSYGSKRMGAQREKDGRGQKSKAEMTLLVGRPCNITWARFLLPPASCTLKFFADQIEQILRLEITLRKPGNLTKAAYFRDSSHDEEFHVLGTPYGFILTRVW